MPCDRRDFLRITLGSAAATLLGGRAGGAREVEQITSNLAVVRGPVNGVLIARPGGAVAIYGDPRDVPAPAKTVLFTHHRRDVVWAGKALVRQGAQAVAPEAEKDLFTSPADFWDKYRTKRFHDYACQSSRVLAEPMALARTVRDGDMIMLNTQTGELNVQADAQAFAARIPLENSATGHQYGMGRELFGLFRAHASPAESGACNLFHS